MKNKKLIEELFNPKRSKSCEDEIQKASHNFFSDGVKETDEALNIIMDFMDRYYQVDADVRFKFVRDIFTSLIPYILKNEKVIK